MKNFYLFLNSVLTPTIEICKTRFFEYTYLKNTRIEKNELVLSQSIAHFEFVSQNSLKKAYNQRLRVRIDIFHIDIIFEFY